MFDLSSRVCTRQVPSYHRAAENQPASRRWWRRWTRQLARMIRVTREWWPFASSERQFIGSRREVRFALGFLLLLSRISQSRNNFSFLPLLSHQIETKVITSWLLQQPLAIRIVVSIFLPAGELPSFSDDELRLFKAIEPLSNKKPLTVFRPLILFRRYYSTMESSSWFPSRGDIDSFLLIIFGSWCLSLSRT